MNHGGVLIGLLIMISVAPALAAPEDIVSYCQRTSRGSYSMEAYCREREDEAYRAMASRAVEQRILDYCGRSATTWTLLKYCVDREEEARARLGR